MAGRKYVVVVVVGLQRVGNTVGWGPPGVGTYPFPVWEMVLRICLWGVQGGGLSAPALG